MDSGEILLLPASHLDVLAALREQPLRQQGMKKSAHERMAAARSKAEGAQGEGTGRARGTPSASLAV